GRREDGGGGGALGGRGGDRGRGGAEGRGPADEGAIQERRAGRRRRQQRLPRLRRGIVAQVGLAGGAAVGGRARDEAGAGGLQAVQAIGERRRRAVRAGRDPLGDGARAGGARAASVA